VLEGMRSRPDQLVELLPQRPRERDRRWMHTLSPADEGTERPSDDTAVPPKRLHPERAADPTPDLAERVARLEDAVAELRKQLHQLREERFGAES